MNTNHPEQHTASTPEHVLLQWQAPAEPAHKRGTWWYVVASAFVLISLIYSIQTGAWTFGVLLVLMTAVYVQLHRKDIGDKTMTITDTGFQLNDTYTPWGEADGFWMLSGKGYIQLHIGRLGKKSDAIIQIGNMDPELVRRFLLQFTAERSDRGEHILDMITRLLKI